MNIIKKCIASLTITTLLAACSERDCTFDLAGDQLRLADTFEKGSRTYYLYTRTTGFQEKVVYFELYDQKPEFDKCTYRANIDQAYMVAYDDYPVQQYVRELTLQPNQPEKLKITYTTDVNEGIENVYDVKLSR